MKRLAILVVFLSSITVNAQNGPRSVVQRVGCCRKRKSTITWDLGVTERSLENRHPWSFTFKSDCLG